MEKNKNVGLRLTMAERKLILEVPIRIGDKLANLIRATRPRASVMLTLDDLIELGWYVVAEANRTPVKKLQNKLDAVFAKIQDSLQVHIDEDPPKSFKHVPRLKSVAGAGLLRMGAPRMRPPKSFKHDPRLKWALNRAHEIVDCWLQAEFGMRDKDKPVAQFPLGGAERARLMEIPKIRKTIVKKLAVKKTLTVYDVINLLLCVGHAMPTAPSQFATLNAIARELTNCLQSEGTWSDEARQQMVENPA